MPQLLALMGAGGGAAAGAGGGASIGAGLGTAGGLGVGGAAATPALSIGGGTAALGSSIPAIGSTGAASTLGGISTAGGIAPQLMGGASGGFADFLGNAASGVASKVKDYGKGDAGKDAQNAVLQSLFKNDQAPPGQVNQGIGATTQQGQQRSPEDEMNALLQQLFAGRAL